MNKNNHELNEKLEKQNQQIEIIQREKKNLIQEK